jgi:hypothetical protein
VNSDLLYPAGSGPVPTDAFPPAGRMQPMNAYPPTDCPQPQGFTWQIGASQLTVTIVLTNGQTLTLTGRSHGGAPDNSYPPTDQPPPEHVQWRCKGHVLTVDVKQANGILFSLDSGVAALTFELR